MEIFWWLSFILSYTAITCSASNITHETETDGIPFRVFTDKINWINARQNCVQNNMDLADIISKNENDALDRYLDKYYQNSGPFWIGGTSAMSPGHYYWVRTGAPLGYTNWNLGGPDNPNQEWCIQIGRESTYLWDIDDCSGEKSYICRVL